MYKYRFNTYGDDLSKIGKTRLIIKNKQELIVEGCGMFEDIYAIDSECKYGDDFIIAYNIYDDYEPYIFVKEFDDIYKYLDKLKEDYTKTINYWGKAWSEDDK